MKKLPGLLVLVLIFGFLIFGFHYGLYFFLENQGGFQIKSITVTGLRSVSQDDVIRLSGLRKARTIFDVDLLDTAVNISSHPLVRYAVVRRNPPGEILIDIKEIQPIVRLQMGKQRVALGEKGEVIFQKVTGNFPLLTLDYSPVIEKKRISDAVILLLLSRLAHYRGKEKIDSVVFKRNEGTYVVFRSLPNTLFYLGRAIGSASALEKAAGIIEQIRKKGIKLKYVDINRDNAIGVVD